jgi:hypothetical protein
VPLQTSKHALPQATVEVASFPRACCEGKTTRSEGKTTEKKARRQICRHTPQKGENHPLRGPTRRKKKATRKICGHMPRKGKTALGRRPKVPGTPARAKAPEKKAARQICRPTPRKGENHPLRGQSHRKKRQYVKYAGTRLERGKRHWEDVSRSLGPVARAKQAGKKATRQICRRTPQEGKTGLGKRLKVPGAHCEGKTAGQQGNMPNMQAHAPKGENGVGKTSRGWGGATTPKETREMVVNRHKTITRGTEGVTSPKKGGTL